MKRKEYPKFALLIFFFSVCSWYGNATPRNKTYQVNIGVLLDDLNSWQAKIWKSCLELALSDFYLSNSHYKSRLVLNTRDSKNTAVGAAAAAIHLIKKSQVQAILGPATSTQTNFVISLGDEARVPIISFSATSPALTSRGSSYFFQFSENDSCQVRAISALVKEFGWRRVVPILVDNEFAEGVMSSLADALQKVDAEIPHRSLIRASATDDQIAEELTKLMMMGTRVLVVHMTSDLSSRMFAKAKQLGMMSEGYVWISTTKTLNSLKSLSSSVIQSMQGVLGVRTYIRRTTKLEELELRWKLQFQRDNPTIIDAQLDVFALWLYDAAQALAMAVEKVWSPTTPDFRKSYSASLNLTDLETLGVSEYGPKLCKALSITGFEGILGNFSLVDRQLQSFTFELVNVNGGGATTIGFWTTQDGLMRTLGPIPNPSSKSKGNLGPIIWTGESLSVPIGWELPTSGKKLRIGVPVKLDFTELVNVSIDPKTGTTEVTGFIIDIFKAVVKELPYALHYELIPFAKPDGTSAGNETELCYQVYLGNYDVVVGDVIINANTSKYTDFSMPFANANLGMLVLAIDMERKSAWTFIEPWNWELWLGTSACWLHISFIIWLLQPPDPNDDRHVLLQIGTFVLLCCPLTFNAEKVGGKYSKAVLYMWMILQAVLVLSYSAILHTEYTKPAKPIVTDINYLLKEGENVGYMAGAYTSDLLRHAGFDRSNRKGFETMEDIKEALLKGSAKGGIGAFVGGNSHMNIFVQKNCNKYFIVSNVIKTLGYGFVLRKRNPILSDISQAILNLRGGEKMINISKRWFNKAGNCQKSIPSTSLGIESFWQLFLIVFIFSILALIVYKLIGYLSQLKTLWSNLQGYVRNKITTMPNSIAASWSSI